MPSTTGHAEPIVVKVTRVFEGNAAEVFDAWITPAIARRFFFATKTGTVVRCDMDARPGGEFTLIDRRSKDGGEPGTHDVRHIGHYIEVERPRKIRFDFSVPDYSKEVTVVTLEFSRAEDCSCELLLTHQLGNSGTARQYKDRTQHGWTVMLGNLAEALGA